MLKKNPALKDSLEHLASLQYHASQKFAPQITEELLGISEGASLSVTDLVILNNYTDFRDIDLTDEGCSTVHLQNETHTLSGQTWDMHRSAKNYVCTIKINPCPEAPAQIIFSLIGCVGLMGFNQYRLGMGVNNINTKKAKAQVIWPVLVREILRQKTIANMRTKLINAKVTSGHNYLLSGLDGGEHWEVTPGLAKIASEIKLGEEGGIFHTNHCINPEIQKLEDQASLSSTTFSRYLLLNKKIPKIKTLKDFYGLLTDHEEYPKSICSHYESGLQDPSFTCGGAIGDLAAGHFRFWRGCPVHDHDYKEYFFKLDHGDFSLTDFNA
jgi:isopenicillin-N N-acyltransferase-like protein